MNFSGEISELKDFISDRKLYYERTGKKAVWSLKLAELFALKLKENGK